MKTTKLLFMFFAICICTKVAAQIGPCCTLPSDPNNCTLPIPLISTDPTNNFFNSQNNERSDMINNVDWMQPQFQYWNFDSPNTNKGDVIQNYFYQNDVGQHYIQNFINSDFNPKDGWELMKRDFGYLHDNTTPSNVYPNTAPANAPYYLLYNKYSGKLRVLAVISGIGAQQAISVNLQFSQTIDDPGNPNYSNLEFSGLLSTYDIATALDQKTTIKMVSSMAAYHGKTFFYADFQMSYDPCTCLHESAIEIYFTTFNQLSISEYGRFLGASTPISTTAKPIDPTDDFLTSVFRDNTDPTKVNAGHLVYTDYDQLKMDLQADADIMANKEELKTALEGFATVLKVGAIAAAPEAAPELEAASAVLDFFAGQVGGESISPPSVMRGEITLRGTIDDSRPGGNTDILLANPGSKSSNSKPDYNNDPNQWPNFLYPTYNKTMGVFALLNTPKADQCKVNKSSSQNSSGADGTIHTEYKVYEKYGWKLLAPIIYTFNPALDIDYTNTYVKGMIVVESALNGNSEASSVHGLNKGWDKASGVEYYTDLQDLASLSQNIPSLEYSTGYTNTTPTLNLQHTLYLKLAIIVQYKSLNSSGVPNKSLFFLKYKIDVNPPIPDFTGITSSGNTSPCENPLTIGATNYTSSQDISCWNTITVNGNLTASTGANVTITSGTEVDMNGESALQGEIILQTNTSNIAPKLSSVITDQSDIKGFCKGTNTNYQPYLAYQSSARMAANNLQASTDTKPVITKGLSLEIHPNPFIDKTEISYSVGSGDKVLILITDMLGRKIELVNQYQSKGNYQFNLSGAELEAGVYICTLQTNGSSVTKRVVVVK
jgi:hypothetical protein